MPKENGANCEAKRLLASRSLPAILNFSAKGIGTSGDQSWSSNTEDANLAMEA